MNLKRVLIFLFIGACFNSAVKSASADELSGRISVRVYGKSNPTEVIICGTKQGEVTCKKSLQENGLSYVGEIRYESGGLFYKYTLVASWGDGDEQLYLRIPEPAFSSELSFRMYHNTPPANQATIDEIEARGKDLMSNYKTYFDARHVYRKMKAVNPGHIVAIKAARLWFDAAYRLATDKTAHIDMDEEAIKENQKLSRMAQWDERFGAAYCRVNRPGYIEGMTAQATAVGWRDVGMIPKLISSGQLANAERLNTHYLELYRGLGKEERENVTKWYGVNLKLLQNNALYIEKLGR